MLEEIGLAADTAARAGTGRYTLRGRVVAVEDGRALAAATVILGEGQDARTVVTDSAGRFVADGLAPGSLRVVVRYLGFASRTAVIAIPSPSSGGGPGHAPSAGGTGRAPPGGDTLGFTLRMDTRPVPLPALSVTVEGAAEDLGKLAGFRERRARGFGHFLDRKEIEKTPGHRLSDVLRSVPGIRVARCPGKAPPVGCWTVEPAHGPTKRLGAGGLCKFTFYVDGARATMVRYFGSAGFGGLDEIVGDKDDLAAVEVYTGPAQIPPQFSGVGAGCGVVAIWTR